MMEDDDRETIYRDYTATMQRHLVTLLGRYMVGKDWQEIPSFINMIHPDIDRSVNSAEQAKQHINEIFGIDIEKALKERG